MQQSWNRAAVSGHDTSDGATTSHGGQCCASQSTCTRCCTSGLLTAAWRIHSLQQHLLLFLSSKVYMQLQGLVEDVALQNPNYLTLNRESNE